MRKPAKYKRILIADEDLLVTNIVSRHLSGQGYQCETASNGERALAKLKANVFDLIIFSMAMNDKSGNTIFPIIKAMHPNMPSILIADAVDIDMVIKLVKDGAYDYIIKPISMNMLSICVERSLDKKRLLLENKNYQLHFNKMVKQQTENICKSFINALPAIAFAQEAKYKYSSGHSYRVAEMAEATARKLGMPPHETEQIKFTGLIHDIGKVGVKETILCKEGKLTREEYLQVASHCTIGEQLLSPMVRDEKILKMVRHHHERYDGGGYPDGLSATVIPPGARILAVVDAYDAMTSERPYRKAVNTLLACAELKKHAGTQFDPIVVDAFIATLVDNNRPKIPKRVAIMYS